MKQMIVYVMMCVCIALVGSTQLAYATNESDYKYGYRGGDSEWDSCAHTNGEGDCTYAHQYCTNTITYVNGTAENLAPVGNITACVDGYAHAWNHFCNHVEAKKADEPCPLSQHDLS